MTPSFNQGQFIEETIRSVLLQGYPDIEYLVIDGGSTDNSREIIEKYSPWLAHWVSEPDRGQSHAINKGLRRSTGETVAYINSDDIYLKDAFWKVARTMPDCSWVVGACYLMRSREHPLGCDIPAFVDDLESWYGRKCGLPQPSTFLRRKLLTQVGLFDEVLSHAFDHEFWIRLIIAGHRPTILRSGLASFRVHADAKTAEGPTQFRDDLYATESKHLSTLPHDIRASLDRSRPARRWETEIRDALQQCSEGYWRSGGPLLLKRLFDVRLLKALFTRPDILVSVLGAIKRRLPTYVRQLTRSVFRSDRSAESGNRSNFVDPLGEYDLWSIESFESNIPSGEKPENSSDERNRRRSRLQH